MYQWGFPDSARGKEPASQFRRRETWVRSLGQKDTLEEGMATHSSILAWRIPWGEESGRLQSIGSQELDVTDVTLCISIGSLIVANTVKNRKPDAGCSATLYPILVIFL